MFLNSAGFSRRPSPSVQDAIRACISGDYSDCSDCFNQVLQTPSFHESQKARKLFSFLAYPCQAAYRPPCNHGYTPVQTKKLRTLEGRAGDNTVGTCENESRSETRRSRTKTRRAAARETRGRRARGNGEGWRGRLRKAQRARPVAASLILRPSSFVEISICSSTLSWRRGTKLRAERNAFTA